MTKELLSNKLRPNRLVARIIKRVILVLAKLKGMYIYVSTYLKDKFFILYENKQFQLFLKIFAAAFLLGLINVNPAFATDQLNINSKRTWTEFFLDYKKRSSNRSWAEFFSESKTFLRAKRLSISQVAIPVISGLVLGYLMKQIINDYQYVVNEQEQIIEALRAFSGSKRGKFRS